MQPYNQPSVRNYNNVGTKNNGFQYKIVPLSFNLQQRTSGIKKDVNIRCICKFGDIVKGKSIDDNKTYSGRVINITFDEKTNKPLIIYILDSKTRKTIGLMYKSIVQLKHNNENNSMKINIDKAIDNALNECNININKQRLKRNIIHSIKPIMEQYYLDAYDQMNIAIDNQKKLSKKNEKIYGSRQQFLSNILGKVTYNKVINKGTFAPIPVSALHLVYRDFYYLNKQNNMVKTLPEDNTEKTFKLISELSKIYYRNEFKFLDTGSTYILQTNLVFKTVDDVIDFFENLQNVYKKVYKSIEINWLNFVKKFRNYLS